MALTPEEQGQIQAPNDLTEVAQPSVDTPNDLTEIAQPDVSAPNDLTELAQPSISAPTALTTLEQPTIARPTPCITLGLNFAQENYQIAGSRKTLADAINFSRSTTATYWGRDLDAFGNWVYSLKTAAIDEPCLAYDPSTLEPLGLQVFGAATNLVLNSDTLVTQSVTVTAVEHTLHFTGTGTVALSGAFSGSLVGTGTGEASRVSLTFTPTAGSLTLTVTGSVTVAQLETGSIVTPYIPTLGSQVTRAADIATVDDLSGWYNQGQGCLFTSSVRAGLSAINPQPSAELSDGSSFNSIVIRSYAGFSGTFFSVGGVGTTIEVTQSSTAEEKVAFNISSELSISVGGELVSSVKSSIIPATLLKIGALTGNTAWSLNGHIKALNYYPSALNENEMKLITL